MQPTLPKAFNLDSTLFPAGSDGRRLQDLVVRLVASGPKAHAVSASECHEIADGVRSLCDALRRIGTVLAEDGCSCDGDSETLPLAEQCLAHRIEHAWKGEP